MDAVLTISPDEMVAVLAAVAALFGAGYLGRAGQDAWAATRRRLGCRPPKRRRRRRAGR
jgi:hypothetical protein